MDPTSTQRHLAEQLVALREAYDRAADARVLHEMRLNSLLELSRRAHELDEDELVQLTLEEVVRVTHSEVGYLHFVNQDQESLRLVTWTRETLRRCAASYESHYPLSRAGIWADCVRLRRPVIHNDYPSTAERRGYPEGHVPIKRHASVPVLDGERVTMVLGVGNKPTDYTDADTRQMLLASDGLWKIVQKKRSERELRAHAAALEEEARRKNEYLAMLAHELRAPLAPINSALEIVDRANADSELASQARQIIARHVTHLSRLVSDLLEAARATTGHIALRRGIVDLRCVAREAVESTRAHMRQSCHDLTLTLPADLPLIDGDHTRLVQVAVNLLSNAAAFTPNGGQIDVIVERQQCHGLLRVRDNGAGIPADLLPKVFDAFVQSDQPLDRSRGGLGLGLTLVRKLVLMHGGTVEAHSPGPGRGSEFIVRLPLALDAAKLPPSPVPRTPKYYAPRGDRRVMVVDDHRDAAMMLATLLEFDGYMVQVAYDGPSALMRAEQWRPHAMLLDIGLPGLDGFEVARRVRAATHGMGLVLIAVTGYGAADDLAKSKAAGFDHHLVKPVDLENLREILAGALAT